MDTPRTSFNGPSRSSIDGPASPKTGKSSIPKALNSPTTTNGDGQDHDRITQLEAQLAETRAEKDKLDGQYRDLLARLTTMRTTLGTKLKQDAEELDRREQLVQTITAQNEDLQNTIETLQAEVIASNEDASRASRELEIMRSRAFEDSAAEFAQREREIQELQLELEQCRTEKDEWEREALQERVEVDEVKAVLAVMRRDLELEREAQSRDAAELEKERERSSNLQSVLEDFQAGKDMEIRQIALEYESQLKETIQSLAEYKSRALSAEVELQDSTSSTKRLAQLEAEVKEKNILIGKVRHETVILNEHLTEALRRLKRNSSDNHVDRRLVTNILLQFITTPRADSKRFEMLALLASILSWNDPEREKAGLQRTAGVGAVLPQRGWKTPSSKTVELEKGDETESFSNMWVEFLLKEAATGTPPPTSTANPALPPQLVPQSPTRSLPSSPSAGQLNFPSGFSFGKDRMASYSEKR